MWISKKYKLLVLKAVYSYLNKLSHFEDMKQYYDYADFYLSIKKKCKGVKEDDIKE